MPEVFDISKLASKYTHKRVRKRVPPSEKPDKPLRQKAKEFIKKYETRLWVAFYLILFSGSFFSGVFFEGSRLAERIMDRVREEQRSESTRAQPVSDLSSISVTTDPDLVALLTYPDGNKVGEDNDEIRFLEVPQASISHNTASISGYFAIHASQPATGNYLIDFTAKRPGTHTISVQAYSRDGKDKVIFTHEVLFAADETKQYIFTYQKDQPDLTRLLLRKSTLD